MKIQSWGIDDMGNLVAKSNGFNDSSHRLNEIEQRLVLLAILKAREFNNIEQLKDKELIIHADDYMRVFKVERSAAYEALKKAVIGLYRAEWGYKFVNAKGNVEVVYERFTQSAKYVENEGSVKFMFANVCVPMLVELEKNFTSYEIEQIANLKSRYSMRFYELLMRFKGTGVLKISYEELRFRLGLLEHEYSTMSNFKQFVLDTAIRQINENTDIFVKYEQQKRGRVITGFTFKFKHKPQKTTKQIEKANEINLLSQKQADFFASKLANDSGFGSKYARSGEDMQAFTSRISQELQRDTGKLKNYMPALAKVGFKAEIVNK